MTCNCTLAQRTVGDGCQSCNPKLALEFAAERIAELEAALRDKTAQIESLVAKAAIAWNKADNLDAEKARLLAEVARLQHHADAKTSSHNAPVGPCELSEQFRDLVTTGLSITRIAPSDFLAATSEWIGVKDRLPNDETPVLVFTRDSGIYEASIEWERPTFEETYEPFRYWSDRDNRYEFEWDDITHWMPLPPPHHSHGQAVEDAPPVPGV